MNKLAIILVSAVTALTGVAPANAFPTVSAPTVQTSQPVEKVQWREDRRDWRRYSPRYSRDDRRWRNDRRWRDDRRYGDRRWRRDRHHNGSNAGAIIGGLAAGAIIGGALAQPRYAQPPRRYVGGGNSHVNWCYSRYRSYRAYDNTFQPYNGPRQQCYSPY